VCNRVPVCIALQAILSYILLVRKIQQNQNHFKGVDKMKKIMKPIVVLLSIVLVQFIIVGANTVEQPQVGLLTNASTKSEMAENVTIGTAIGAAGGGLTFFLGGVGVALAVATAPVTITAILAAGASAAVYGLGIGGGVGAL